MRVLEATKLAYANEKKVSIISQELGSRDFWRIANSVLKKGKSTAPPRFNNPRCSFASDTTNLLAKNLS